MQKIVLFAVLLAFGFVGYRYAFAESQASKAVKAFATCLWTFDYEAATDLTEGRKAKRFVERRRSGLRIFGNYWSQQLMTLHIGPRFEVMKEEPAPDGKTVAVTLVAEGRVGPTTMAPIGPMTLRETFEATVVRSELGWRLQEVSSNIEELMKTRD